MKIGVIGAGAIGKAFARHAAKNGYEVVLCNSTGGDSLRSIANELGKGVVAGTLQEAVATGIVVLALPWGQLSTMAGKVPSWKDIIVIDATNAILPGFVIVDLGGQPSSEIVAAWFPEARLVKAFNTFTPEMLGADPRQAGGNRVIFYSGNDTDSKVTVAGIIHTLGFAAVDLGRLDEGGRLQQYPGGSLAGLDLIRLR